VTLRSNGTLGAKPQMYIFMYLFLNIFPGLIFNKAKNNIRVTRKLAIFNPLNVSR